MKLLVHITAAALSLLLAGCSLEPRPDGDHAEVSFSAAIHDASTKAGDDVAAPGTVAAMLRHIDKIVCAVYEKDPGGGYTLLESLGHTFDLEAMAAGGLGGEQVVYRPRLLRDRTYSVVFWAMRGQSYNTGDLTAITRNEQQAPSGADESVFDAFSASVMDLRVSGSLNVPVELRRPLARLNVAAADWDPSAEGAAPTSVAVSVDRSHSSFNALTQTAAGPARGTIKAAVAAEPDDVVVDGRTYKRLLTTYLFVNECVSDISCEIRSMQGNTETTSRTIRLTGVPFTPNYTTNIVGDILGGEASSGLSPDGTGPDDPDNPDE